MVAKKIVIAFSVLCILQTSFASFDRLWSFSKDSDHDLVEAWETMSDEEQMAVIKRYQSLNREIPPEMSASLQKRMDWFTQLPEDDKQKMREAWQKMSTQERRELGQRLEKAHPKDRAQIRDEYINKYKSLPIHN